MNVALLVGRVGQIRDMRYTQGGDAVLNFTLATTEGFGERQTTTWHEIVAWKKTAEFVSEYVEVGQQLAIQGTIKKRQWEAQDGSKRSVVEIHANRVDALAKAQGKGGGKKREEAADESSPWGGADPAPRDVDPNEVPF